MPPVSCAILGNGHPEMVVPMERGDTGNHTGATRERCLLYTARRVQPHESLPHGYHLPDGVPAWSWIPFDKELANMSGLAELYADPEVASASSFQRAKVPAAGAQEAEGQFLPGLRYLPDADGYVFKLPDGVESRFRYDVSSGAPRMELRVANRDFAMPLQHDLIPAVQRVIRRFLKPNRRLQRDAEAAALVKSVSTLYNVKAALAADGGNDAEAALWGTAPWKLGVLAGLQVPFDVFLGNPSCGEDGSADDIAVPAAYVARARLWLDILNALRSPFRQQVAPAAPAPKNALPAVPASVQALPVPAFLLPDEMARFPATQPAPSARGRRKRSLDGAEATPHVAERRLASPERDAAALGAAPAESVPSSGDAQRGGEEGAPQADGQQEGVAPVPFPAGPGIPEVPLAAPSVEAKDISSGPTLDYGYGPGGATAQLSYEGPGVCFKPDREIMQRTVLNGKAKVSVNEMCGKIRRKEADGKRPGVPKDVFEEVMVAGFAQYPIGKLVDQGRASARVLFSAPPTEDRDARTKYHNMLVDLCRVSLRQFSKALMP